MFAKETSPVDSAAAASSVQCGDATLTALIHIASAGLYRHFPQALGDTADVELVLDTLRALRPKVAEIETLQGVLHIVNGRWPDAARTLRDVIDAAPAFGYAKAMYAYCLASKNDPGWRSWAEQALEGEPGVETQALIRALTVRADLEDAKANYRGGGFVLPDSYRELDEQVQARDAAPVSTGAPDPALFASHAFLRA